MPALSDKTTLTAKKTTRVPAPGAPSAKGAGGKTAAIRPKLTTPERYPFLRPEEQKKESGKAVKMKQGERQHHYVKAHKARQRQERR